MSDAYNELLNQFGVQDDLPLGNEPLVATGGSYYEHLVGDYKALFGKIEVIFVDKEKKKCAQDKAGAKMSHAIAKFLIVSDPEKILLDTKSYSYPADLDFGRLVFNQYITLDSTRQWQNARLLKDFTFDGIPEAAVVQGEKGAELIYLKNLPLFVGAPFSFKLEAGTKEGSRFIAKDSLILLDKTLSKEKIIGRRNVVTKILADLDIRLEELKKKNALKQNGAPAPEISDAKEVDDILAGFSDIQG